MPYEHITKPIRDFTPPRIESIYSDHDDYELTDQYERFLLLMMVVICVFLIYVFVSDFIKRVKTRK